MGMRFPFPRRASISCAAAGIALAAAFLAFPARAAGLNDTGQSLCYDNTGATGNTTPCASAADDGRYGRDAAATAGILTKTGAGAAGFDFTKIANDGATLVAGAALGSNASDWACSRDNVTGRMWEVKTSDGGLRDKVWTYTWYSTDGTTNGGDAGSVGTNTCGGTLSGYSDQCNTANYIAAVNAAGMCGHSDWRLPTVSELWSIALLGDFGPLFPGVMPPPLIDENYFPNTPVIPVDPGTPSASFRSHFVSASTYGPDPTRAWFVIFIPPGGHFTANKFDAESMSVRLVRGGLE